MTKPIISRTGVYGVVMKDGKLLVVKQYKGPHCGKWDLPGGGIEPGETIEGALRREFIEEADMSFTTLQFYKNLTANTDGIDAKGHPYSLHQIGLIYTVDGLSPAHQQKAEMEHAWIDLMQLTAETSSPFVRKILSSFGYKFAL